MAPKKPLKKKGTAAPVKGPKRSSKGSGAGKKGSGKSSTSKAKRPKTEGTSSQRGSSAAPGSSSVAGADSDEESGSDQGIYCICRGPDNHRFMIACDRCEDWFHGDCIGMDKYTGENLVQRYICPNCTDGKLMVTRYKKTCALNRCDRAARMYGDVAREEASIFCSEEHCQLWWEQLVGTLPRSRTGGLYGDVLTQEEFMGLLGTGSNGPRKDGWKIGVEPFGTSSLAAYSTISVSPSHTDRH
jgi:COMPASS component SPP1